MAIEGKWSQSSIEWLNDGDWEWGASTMPVESFEDAQSKGLFIIHYEFTSATIIYITFLIFLYSKWLDTQSKYEYCCNWFLCCGPF